MHHSRDNRDLVMCNAIEVVLQHYLNGINVSAMTNFALCGGAKRLHYLYHVAVVMARVKQITLLMP